MHQEDFGDDTDESQGTTDLHEHLVDPWLLRLGGDAGDLVDADDLALSTGADADGLVIVADFEDLELLLVVDHALTDGGHVDRGVVGVLVASPADGICDRDGSGLLVASPPDAADVDDLGGVGLPGLAVPTTRDGLDALVAAGACLHIVGGLVEVATVATLDHASSFLIIGACSSFYLDFDYKELFVGAVGLEPTTSGLKVRCSAD